MSRSHGQPFHKVGVGCVQSKQEPPPPRPQPKPTSRLVSASGAAIVLKTPTPAAAASTTTTTTTTTAAHNNRNNTPATTPVSSASHVSHSAPIPARKRPSLTPLTQNEIQSRIEGPTQSQVCTIGDIQFKYAWISQRGYYPNDPTKENQDSYSILPQINKIENGAFFAVYDGHGDKGHLCSRYVRDKLPGAISYFVGTALADQPLTPENLCPALRDSHRSVNQMLIDNSSIDVSLSGTTSISILFTGRKMCINNVGDSRAIVVSVDETGKLKAYPLSSDQTPYRKDERERVKSHGARILSMDQIEGLEPIHENWGEVNLGEEIDEGGDPPRVWSPKGAYPGVAFTRSFGDLFAKVLGVYEEPEILIRDVQPNDRYIIIASDGVFEFLTNQMVADMVAQRDDPLDACRAIVAQSYELWLQYEVRTDDITIIALFIEGNEHLEPTHDKLIAADGKRLSQNENMMKLADNSNKPVRRVASREKKKTVLQALDNSGIIVSRFESRKQLAQYKVPKTEEEQSQLLLAMSDNILFHHLTDDQRLSLIEMCQRVPVKSNDVIIKQGDVGDRFYIVASGCYEVRVKSDPHEHGDGRVVYVYESGPSQHPCFGELALMYGKPRAASVVAITDGMLWAIDRFVFVNSLMRTQALRKEIFKTLKRVKAFQTLRVSQLQRLVDLVNEASFVEGEIILKQGDEGKKFYIIVEGSCRLSRLEEGQEVEIAILKENDHFGEDALLSSTPLDVSVTTLSYVEVLTIEKSGFEEVLGNLKELVETKRSKGEVEVNMNAPSHFKDIQLNCCVAIDPFGSLTLGTFNNSIPNVSIKTFLLDSKDFETVKEDIVTATEGARAINDYLLKSSNQMNCSSSCSLFLPKFLTSFCEQNSFHMIFDSPVISTLESWSLYKHSTSGGKLKLIESLPYVASCIVMALEGLHSAGIIYRSVQPECVHINSSGQVIFFDYGLSKVGCIGGRTFTLCGVPEYLAPEQLTQRGHNEAVDFWEFGVLLYELLARENPFSAGNANELAIMHKISQFGQASFSHLTYPNNFSPSLIHLINSLVVPHPGKRLGMMEGGIDSLKAQEYFINIVWNNQFFEQPSPLLEYAQEMLSDNLSEGISADILEKWNTTNDNTSLRIRSTTWMEELLGELN